MASTIYYNGVVIKVPTNELAEALRQINTLPSKPMGLGMVAPPVQKTMDLDFPPAPDLPGDDAARRSDTEITLAFLKTIQDHEISGGAAISEVMAALGVNHPKGVGSKASVVNRVIDKAGFAIPDVYSNPRDAHGDRYWKAGARLADAIRALDGTGPTGDENSGKEEG